MTVKGGGHSYGAYGLTGAMIIDMVEFREVSLDETTNIVRVGAGMRLGNLANTLFDLGERAYVYSFSSPLLPPTSLLPSFFLRRSTIEFLCSRT